MNKVNCRMLVILFAFILSILFFSGCLLSDQQSLEYTFGVNSDGTSDFTSISEAIAHAQDHDIIFVHNGLYEENLVINKSIHLIGENKFSTILDGNGEGTVISITADGVKVTHFTIQNSGSKSTYYEMDAGVNSNASTVQVSNCICNNTTVGLQVKNANENRLDNNLLQNNLYGIFLFHSSYNTIDNNLVESNSYYGCYLYSGSNKNQLSDNLFVDNKYGVRIKSEQNQVIQNLFRDNIRGVWFCCGAKNNTVYHNTFVNNTENNGRDNFNENKWYHPQLGGNYWDNYYGNDTDSDGFGDTSYIVDQTSAGRIIAEDTMPLLQPTKDFD